MSNVNRNVPCPCGSGKKFKKCCINKVPREISLTLDFGKPTRIDKLCILKDNTIECLSNERIISPIDARIESSYEREKSPKIINRSYIGSDILTVDPNRALYKYDLIYAIDTNTKTINSGMISVSCIVLCKLIKEESKTIALYSPINCLEFRNVIDSHEKYAWRKYIQLIMANPAYKPNIKIGIIVDSDLENIPKYNLRKMPIVENFVLPDHFELLYASSDTGKEFLANRLIAECDREANILFEKIRHEDLSNEASLTKDSSGVQFRLWQLES